jgi:asparagine synthase (glutamine-hydrolysing)
MCGITGIIIANQPSETVKTSEGLLCIERMTDRIAHRGPDGKGRWGNEPGNVFLGHRRLSVIDLSEAAAQPMHLNNRYTIVHNGEIYNHVELRKTLQQAGYAFRTQSDTEVILAAYDCWKDRCLQQFEGMFAFAIWDEKEQLLFAARDRFGEKPFFYYEDAEHFLFASEMKALWAAGVEKKTDEKMLLNYLTLGHVQNSMDKDQTFFENICSLPPSHFLKLSRFGFKLKTEKYWNINREIRINIPAAEALEKFNELFVNSVTKRLRSDVAVGSSLSGGLDSSSIVFYLNELRNKRPETASTGPLKTFSAVFPGFEKDESLFIRSVVERSGIENHQVTPTADGLISCFEKLCYHQEEPFQSSGVYAQYKVFELAGQQGVKVLLDGQGADEVLAGYPRYIHWYLQEVLSRHKVGATQKERKALRKNHQEFRWNIRNMLAAFLPAHAAIQLEKAEFHKTFHQPDIGRDFLRSVTGREWEGIHKPIVTKLNDILYFNTLEMGLEELLRFADRNSMSQGIETRLPFLDHRLVEFIFSLPAQYKIHEGRTKWLLRQAMNKKLPDEIVWRTDKTGFEPPQQQWMKDPDLQDYIHEAKKKLVNAKILNPEALHKKIEPLPAYEDNNYDWRYLCAAHII